MDPRAVLDAIDEAAQGSPTADQMADAAAMVAALAEGGPRPAAAAWARRLRGLAARAVPPMAPADQARAMAAVEAALRACAPFDLDCYMLFTEWNREPAKQFYLPRRRVLLPIVRDLQDLADGRIVFLSVSMPPRTGKSTLGIFFLTFMMGRAPDKANLMSGHSDKLTKGFHEEALAIIRDGTYRFAEVFPEAAVAGTSYADETISLGRRSRFPTLTCRSVDGTLTGAVEVGRGAVLYCDDLVSDREEALNAERMDKLYQSYLNQLKDRMNDGARQLMVATRWVPNDPIGRIREQYEGDPRYRFAVLPAVDAEGRSNFVYDYGLGFSDEYYRDMRDSLAAAGEEDSWAAKYMGEPFWMGGLMFPEDSLRRFDALPEGEPDAVLAVCDTKDKGADYACQPIVAVYGDDHYVVSVVCDNGLPEAVEPRLADALARWGVQAARYESNAAGGRVADAVAERVRASGHVIRMTKKFSTENKETRILVDSGWVKARCLFRAEPPDADYRRFMRQLTGYTTEGRVRHDDAPDAMSMYKRFASSVRRPRAEPTDRPW